VIREVARARSAEVHDAVFLELVCGARAVIARLDELLVRWAPAPGPGPVGARAPAPAGGRGEGEDDDEVMHALLGLVAIRARIAAVTLAAGPARGPRDAPGPCDRALPPGGWLR
jgi:hypothetical protein